MPTRRAASSDPTLDLGQLTDSEKRQLLAVLQRDGELQEAERMRIVKLKSYVRQEDRSADALLQRSEFNERYCIRCYRRFLLLFNPWVCCCLCSLRVCRGRCAQRSREFSGSFVCHVCDRSRLCMTGQYQWFYDAVKKKFKTSGSAKVILSLNRDAQQFAEAYQSVSSQQQPGLAIERIFAAPGTATSAQGLQQGSLAESDMPGRRGGGLYRTELTLATQMDAEFNSAAAAAATALDAVDESAASTVGLQITTFQSQLHDVLRRLQAELRARVADEREASTEEAKEVADRYGREIAELISTFAQTLHATLASRDGSPCSVESRLQRVQRLVQQEVENAIGLSADRVIHRPGSVAAAAAATTVPAPCSEDGEDSGLELEGRLADFVVQKVMDDHLVRLEEAEAAETAAAASARRSSPTGVAQQPGHFFSYRQLPNSLTPSKGQSAAAVPAAISTDRMKGVFGEHASGQSSSSTQPMLSGVADTTRSSTSQHLQQQQQQQQQQLDKHIDSLFAFNQSSDSFQHYPHHKQQLQLQISSTPKPPPPRNRGDSSARPARMAAPQPPRSDLRLGRFSSLIAAAQDSDSEAEDEGGSCDSWDRAPPILTMPTDAAEQPPPPPLLLRFGRIDWDQNERTDPRFCAKPDASVIVPRGERVTFKAVVDGTEPIEVLWHRLKSGRVYEIRDSDKYEQTSDPEGDRSHSLTVYHAAESDGGAYLLIAVNELQAVMHGFKLKIDENPHQCKAPAFTEPMSDTRAREGRTARFHCRVAGQPNPRVTFLRDGAPIKADGCKYHVVNTDSRSYELQINDVTKSDDAEYSCLATNAAGSTQCDCQLLVYRLAEEDEALKRIEGEIQQTQASMISAAKDMYRASGKIRQLDANFGRLNQRLSSMEKQLVTVGPAYPESGALQRITGHMLQRLADHEASTAAGAAAAADATAESAETSIDAPVSDWSLTSGEEGAGGASGSFGGLSTFESIPQTSSTSKIVYEIENVDEIREGASDGKDAADEDELLASTERRIYLAASRNSLLRQKLDELERQATSGDSGTFDADSIEKALAGLQLLAARTDAEVNSIEAAADQLTDRAKNESKQAS